MAERPKSLEVFLADELVGTITEHRRKMQLRYDDAVLKKYRGLSLLSCSLPVNSGPHDPTNFLDGVLPEGDFRAGLAARAGVTANDTYGLIAQYGRDIAGAISIRDPQRPIESIRPSALPLSEDDLRAEVEALPTRPLGVHDDSELSIAGLQNKLLLVADGSGWARPIGGQLSTHILKLDSQAHPGVVRAEAEVMLLAKAVGLTSVDVEVVAIGAIDCLIVERFDRVVDSDGQVSRVHQEDACQALGLRYEQKYELPDRGRFRGGGGPEFSQIAGLLDAYSVSPLHDLDRLAQVATFTALTGNSDAHGKNLALLHVRPGGVRLAPLYDTVPTILFPRLKDEAAMTIGGAVDLALVGKEALRREARHWNVDPDRMVAEGVELAEQLADGCAALDSTSAVRQMVEERVERFLAS